MSRVVIRTHEIVLKGGNRRRFTARLARNARRACADLPVGSCVERHGRLVMDIEDDAAWPTVRERLARVFGIANFSLAQSVAISDRPDELGPLCEAVLRALAGRRFGSFRIVTKRADKRYPLRSPEVNARLGAFLKERTGMRVDLDDAELTVTVEILPGEFLHSIEKVRGAGGLPVGTAGHVLALLSGGIDSPVAALRMMRRGCRVTFVHFHATPYLDRSSQEKCRECLRLLVLYQLDARLILVPFGEVQKEIVTRVPKPTRVILYRRMMMRIASAIAREIGAAALVTGDSLGQVASQTLTNLGAVEDAAELPLFRPLVGMDKLEVIEEAKRLGTFDVSIEPDQDCCSLFVPRHPTTRARLDRLRQDETELDVAALVQSAVAGATVERYAFPTPPREPVVAPFLEASSRPLGVASDTAAPHTPWGEG